MPSLQVDALNSWVIQIVFTQRHLQFQQSQQIVTSRTQMAEWLVVFVLCGDEEKFLVKMYDL